jgi:hypothetical protein
LPSSSLSGLSSLILFHYLPPVANLPPVSLIAVANCHRVVDTGGKFSAGVVDTGGPVSTTLAKLVAKFAACVTDTGGKFATGAVDTGGAPVLANISANFQKNSKRS